MAIEIHQVDKKVREAPLTYVKLLNWLGMGLLLQHNAPYSIT